MSYPVLKWSLPTSASDLSQLRNRASINCHNEDEGERERKQRGRETISVDVQLSLKSCPSLTKAVAYTQSKQYNTVDMGFYAHVPIVKSARNCALKS